MLLHLWRHVGSSPLRARPLRSHTHTHNEAALTLSNVVKAEQSDAGFVYLHLGASSRAQLREEDADNARACAGRRPAAVRQSPVRARARAAVPRVSEGEARDAASLVAARC